jgi:hypothetical protein
MKIAEITSLSASYLARRGAENNDGPYPSSLLT